MGKIKPKIYLKLGILLLGIPLLIISCQKDDNFIDSNNLQSFKTEKIAKFKFITNSELNKSRSIKNVLTKLNSNQKNSISNVSSRIIYSDVYDFSIDTDYSLLSTYDKYKTYTFKVYRDNANPDLLENLVIDLDTITGETTQLLFNYPIINGQYDFNNVTAQQITDSNLTYARFSSDCYTVVTYQTSIIEHTCGLDGNHSPGEACYDGIIRAWTEVTGEWVETEICESTDGQTNNGEDSGNVDAGGSGNGNNTDNNDNNDEPGIQTMPLDDGEVGRRNECNKINDLIQGVPSLANSLQILETKTTENQEYGAYKLASSSTVYGELPQSSGEIAFPTPLEGEQYEVLAHTHNSPASTTLSIFSWYDLETFAKLMKNNKLDNSSFVTYLMTADSTRYAITFNNINKFLEFMATHGDDNFNMVVAQKRVKVMEEFYNLFEDTEIEPLIDIDNTPEENLVPFLKMLQNNNMGISLFEVDSLYLNYQELSYNNSTNQIIKTPCP